MSGEKRRNALLWLLRSCACVLVVLGLTAGFGVSAITVDHHAVDTHSHEEDPLHAAEVVALELLTGVTLAIVLRRSGPLRNQRPGAGPRVERVAAKWWSTRGWSPRGAMGDAGMVLRI